VLDASFGTNGEARVAFPEMAGADSIALQPDGNILLVGTMVEPVTNLEGLALVRYRGQ
jgi:hypothetical protein